MAITTGSRGQLRGQVIGSCEDFGIDEGSVSIIIRTFMELNTDRAVHWLDMGRGVLLLAQTDPNNPASGVIYVYDKSARTFWGLNFEDGWDDKGNQFLTPREFEALADEYSLNDYAVEPQLLRNLADLGIA